MVYDIGDARTWKDAGLNDHLLADRSNADQRLVRLVYDSLHHRPTKPNIGMHYHTAGVGKLHQFYFSEWKEHEPDRILNILDKTMRWVDRKAAERGWGYYKPTVGLHQERLHELVGLGDPSLVSYDDLTPEYFIFFQPILGPIPFRDQTKSEVKKACDKELLMITPGYKRRIVLSVHHALLVPPKGATQAESENSELFVDWVEV